MQVFHVNGWSSMSRHCFPKQLTEVFHVSGGNLYLPILRFHDNPSLHRHGAPIENLHMLLISKTLRSQVSTPHPTPTPTWSWISQTVSKTLRTPSLYTPPHSNLKLHLPDSSTASKQERNRKVFLSSRKKKIELMKQLCISPVLWNSTLSTNILSCFLLKFIFKGIYPAEMALSSLSLFNLSEQPIRINQSSLNTIQ